jgi:hypothetical protein
MHGENLWKFMETRARAPRALYKFILPLPIIQYDDCTNVQNGRAKGTCLGSLKTEQAIRCCWVRESASTHPSPRGISSAAGTDPNCFGCEFIKKMRFRTQRLLRTRTRRRRAERRTVAPGTNRRGRATAESRRMKHAGTPRRAAP